MKTIILGVVFIVMLTQSKYVFAKEIPPVYEKIDPFLTTPVPGHLYEIPVVIMRFLPTVDGVNVDITKVPDFYDLGEITLDELKSRIDLLIKELSLCLKKAPDLEGIRTQLQCHLSVIELWNT